VNGFCKALAVYPVAKPPRIFSPGINAAVPVVSPFRVSQSGDCRHCGRMPTPDRRYRWPPPREQWKIEGQLDLWLADEDEPKEAA
jgi:hypothetical protein